MNKVRLHFEISYAPKINSVEEQDKLKEENKTSKQIQSNLSELFEVEDEKWCNKKKLKIDSKILKRFD